MTPKEAFPDDNRATAMNELMVIQEMLTPSIQGLMCVPAHLGSPEEWGVIEAELGKAREHLAASNRCMLALLQLHK